LERDTARFLDNHGIAYIRQKRFNDCRGSKNGRSLPLPFDFFVESMGMAIECDGAQHYHLNHFFADDDKFKELKHRDSIKTDYCNKNGICLVRIRYDDDIDAVLAEALGLKRPS